MLEIHQFPYASDNYAVLIHDPESGKTACVDAGDAAAVLAALEKTGWTLTELWITHHHYDHTDGITEVREATGAVVRGPDKVRNIDLPLKDGAQFEFAGREVRVIQTPGHAADMINYHIPSESLYFAADTLFVMGCGRLIDGSAPDMWESLKKIMALPEETVIYCAHEYTIKNGEFALSVDPANTRLQQAVAEAREKRAGGLPTVPTTLAQELATNPFLRVNDPAIRASMSMQDSSDVAVFGALRRAKDQF